MIALPSPPPPPPTTTTIISKLFTTTTSSSVLKTAPTTTNNNNNDFRSILNQFSDISRYASAFAASGTASSNFAPSTSTNMNAQNNNSHHHQYSSASLPQDDLPQHQLPQPPLSLFNGNERGSPPPPPSSGSSSSLNDVLSSLMGLSEEEWRTLRDSMRFLHTTPRSLLTPPSSTTEISSYISPEDALAGFFPSSNLTSDFSTLHRSSSGGGGGGSTELSEPWLTLLPLIYWLLIILGVVGNVTVILVYAFGRQWRSDLSVYLVNLAVADAMLAIFCLPFTMNQVIEHEWPYSNWMCDLVFYLQLASVLSSVYTLVVIGVDRYMFIIYQKKNRRMSKSTKLLVIIVGWLVTFSICTVQIFVAEVHEFTDLQTGRTHRSCTENLGNMNVAYTIAIFLLTYAIPLIVLATAYYMVGRKLSQMMSEVPPTNGDAANNDASPGTNVTSNNHSNNNWPHQQTNSNNNVNNNQSNKNMLLPGGATDKHLNVYARSAAAAAAATARGPTAANASRLQLRAEFLRLDPRYNLCRTPEMKRIRQKRRIVRMLIVLVILFAISWLPLHSFFLLFTFCQHLFHASSSTTFSADKDAPSPQLQSQLNPELIQIVFIPSHVLAMSSCCVNPIVYCFMSRRFRNDLVKLWRRASQAFAKTVKNACCYCCTRGGTGGVDGDGDYWSHASSFHVVGAVMDEDDGSYAICTTCKDHQHHSHQQHSNNYK